MKFTAEMLAGVLGGSVEGDPQTEVWTFAKIEEGAPGALSFLANPKYEHYLYTSKSSVIIVASDLHDPEGLNHLVSDVNDTTLGPEEYLSGSVYYFDAKTKELSVAVAGK